MRTSIVIVKQPNSEPSLLRLLVLEVPYHYQFLGRTREYRLLYNYLPHCFLIFKTPMCVSTILPNIPVSLLAAGPVLSNNKSLPSPWACWRKGAVESCLLFFSFFCKENAELKNSWWGVNHVSSYNICALSHKPTFLQPHCYLIYKNKQSYTLFYW